MSTFALQPTAAMYKGATNHSTIRTVALPYLLLARICILIVVKGNYLNLPKVKVSLIMC